MTDNDLATNFGRFIGLALTAFLLTCLRGWLLSMCAAIFFPTFVLGFWQWCLIAFTLRSFIAPNASSND